MPIHRRQLLQGLPATLALAALSGSRRARADVPAAERRFLFIFADGGWDPTWVFHPAFDDASVDMPGDGSDRATRGDLAWVSGPGRPSVDSFFSRYGDQTAILNGLEVRSIAHERCQRLVLTGRADDGGMDIPGHIAAGSPSPLPFGHVVFSGPAFLSAQSNSVVRVGASGQLGALIDGTCVEGTDLRLPSSDVAALEDAFVAERAAATADTTTGAQARISAAYARALGDLEVAEDNRERFGSELTVTTEELNAAVELLQSGLSRCAIVADPGFRGERWDHHSDLQRQAPSYDLLFQNVARVCDQLAMSPGTWGESMLDEVTVVVFSEMGRFPRLNASFGKDHWMTTSMMLIGGGIQGGRVVGAYTEGMTGAAIDPGSGEPSSTGVVPEPGHIGATLLTLAGIDPAPVFGADTPAITALLQ